MSTLNRTLYLCGPINGCADAECKDWREYATAQLSPYYTILDPMVRDYRGREDDSAGAIIEGDEADLRACDIVLVNALSGASWGTAMEVRAAHHEYGKRVVTAVDTSRTVSPWLRYHSSIVVGSLAQAINLLRREGQGWAA